MTFCRTLIFISITKPSPCASWFVLFQANIRWILRFRRYTTHLMILSLNKHSFWMIWIIVFKMAMINLFEIKKRMRTCHWRRPYLVLIVKQYFFSRTQLYSGQSFLFYLRFKNFITIYRYFSCSKFRNTMLFGQNKFHFI